MAEEFGPEDSLEGWLDDLENEQRANETIGLFGGRNVAAERYQITRWKKMARLREMAAIASRYDVFHGLTPKSLRRLLEELGPTFVKAGQILSMRSEILPESFCDELKRLRTDVEPMDRATMLDALRAEYSKPLEEIFDAIDDVPLGSASVAQVHKARLVTGELVAVKIQRPNVRDVMAQDISIMRSIARRADRVWSGNQFLDLTSVVDELWQSFEEETDFLVETRALEEFRQNNRGCVFVDCPKPYRRLCTRHVVVMDYVKGIHIDKLAELKEQGYDLDEIGIKLASNYIQQVLDDGFFHADPHPGNLIIHEGKIVYLDLGIMGRLSSNDRRCITDMLMAVGERDSMKLKDGLLRFSASDTQDVDHAHLLADLDQIVDQYGEMGLAELDISAFFNSVVYMARKYGLEMPSTVTMLARSLVTLEGVVNALMPDASTIGIIQQHLTTKYSWGELAKKESETLARETYEAGHGFLRATADLPTITRMLTRGQLGVNLDVKGVDEPLRNMSRTADRLTLSVVVAGLFIGSSIVYFAGIKPVVFGIPVIGFLGYLIALIIGLWIALSIIIDMRDERKRRR